MKVLKVGLTGGIACGKSHALETLRELGALTVDADQLSRKVMEPGAPAYHALIQQFGKVIVGPDRQIDRKRLGSLIFSDEAAREKLNRIVHPHVIRAEQAAIEQLVAAAKDQTAIVIVDAALMIEAGTYRGYDVLVVVYCPPETQLNRLKARDQITEQEALQRIESQMPLLEKVRYGDYIIDSSGTYEQTRQQIENLYRDLLKTCARLDPGPRGPAQYRARAL
jgi:dephospho-CoA kinase